MSAKNVNVVINREEIEEIFMPYVAKKFASEDREWVKLRRNLQVEQKIRRIRHCLLGWTGKYRRTQEGVEGGYNVVWKTPLEEQVQHKFAPPVLCEWNGQGFLAYSYGIKKVHHLLLARTIRELRPRRVLEVGCGNGLNLFMLSNMFPDVKFTGVELTQAGVSAIREMQSKTALPQALIDFSVEPFQDETAFKRIEVVQGNAAKLPFADNSFDLVYTVLALEQMEEVAEQALREIGRVTSGHAVMIEPFRDWNENGMRRDYIVSMDYFSKRIRDLPYFGLSPIDLKDDLPNKIRLGVGYVLSAKAGRS